MFNTIKKFAHTLQAAISGVDARPMRKHSNVIALPVKPPADNGKALADARRSLVNTLSQVLDVKRNALIEEFVDELDAWAADDDYDTDGLVATLHELGFDMAYDYFSYDDWHALAAAVDYYGGYLTVDLQKAVEVVASGDYRHYRRAYDEESLGEAIYSDWLDNAGLYCLPDWLVDAIDFEAIGKDFSCNGKQGKFTSNGYFLPLDD